MPRKSPRTRQSDQQDAAQSTPTRPRPNISESALSGDGNSSPAPTPSRKRRLDQSQEVAGSPVDTPSKRRQVSFAAELEHTPTKTPTKKRQSSDLNGANSPQTPKSALKAPPQTVTPTGTRGRKPSIIQNGTSSPARTPASARKSTATQPVTPTSARGSRTRKGAFTTPTKPPTDGLQRAAQLGAVTRDPDRSARRKNTRHLLERRAADEAGSDDDELGDEAFGQELWDEQGSDGDEDGVDGDAEDHVVLGEEGVPETEPATPSKKPRGRPKKVRTPTPPPETLAPHERYFFQNRPTALKSASSGNTLPAAFLAFTAAEYRAALDAYEDPHEEARKNLQAHHAGCFPLWAAELAHGFAVCLHGYGCKRGLLRLFADYLHALYTPPPAIVIFDALHPDASLRTLLTTLATAASLTDSALSTQPNALVDAILTHLTAHPPATPIHLLISPLHARVLTHADALPLLLTRLAPHPSLALLLAADDPSFPLLLPAPLRANLAFHDATTFAPYPDETLTSVLGGGGGVGGSGTVVDVVRELAGRKTSKVVGREGVRWVLSSLPANARGVYRLLVAELLVARDADAEAGGGAPSGVDEDGEGDEDDPFAPRPARGRPKSDEVRGIEVRKLYRLTEAEFLCSSEMMLWGLLKEFEDHRMVVVRRGRGVGSGDVLDVEMERGDLEGVLEDLIE